MRTKYRINALLPYRLTKVSHCLRLLEKQTPELGKRGAASSDIEITNPDLLICHLDEGATLNMELMVDIGRHPRDRGCLTHPPDGRSAVRGARGSARRM
jgi:DNA-directed RNA polymerase alpha subunit